MLDAEVINKHIDKFIDLKQEEPPKDKKLTIFCDDGDEEVGFIENEYFGDIGLSMFIAKKWILHEELENLLNI